MKRGRALALLLVLTMLLAAGGLALDFNRQLHAPLALPSEKTFVVVDGASFKSVLTELARAGILQGRLQQVYLHIYARISGQSTKIRAGEYVIAPGMSSKEMLALFVSGKVLLHPLRIAEGGRFEDLRRLLQETAFIKQTEASQDPAQLMLSLGRAGQHPEGRFFPDTYHLSNGTTDLAFLQRAAAAMDAVLNEEWGQRAQNLPYSSVDEALIMASIVEKESGVPQERPEIAGVFVNRLRVGMRLQTDPTVIYGMPEPFDGNLRRKDLLADTPYNTYTRTGLPPTPICIPSRESIHAALHPAATKALFFVARGDGTHAFSESLEQHNAAVRRYQLKLDDPEPASPPLKPAADQQAVPTKSKVRSEKKKQ